MVVSVRLVRGAELWSVWMSLAAASLASACGPDLPASGGETVGELDGAVLVINEVLANEPGSNVGGEFVELVNVGDADADLAGARLSDSAGVRHVFAAGADLAPGEAIVVFGAAGSIPPGMSGAVGASSGALGLSNGGDSVSLTNGFGDPISSISYTSALSGTDGVSLNRVTDGDPGAAFALHTELGADSSSPGTRVDGTPFDGDEPPPPPPPPDEDTRIRVVAANLTSGNQQSYDPGHGIRILRGLAPDVALVGEMNFGTDSQADIRAFVDQAFGPEFQFTRQDGVNIPCGVVSRFPIVEAGVVDDPTLRDRDFSYARIDVPGERDLWAVSVHLSGASSTNRATAATALVNFVSARVPTDDLLVVGGDFNTRSRTETCVQRLDQVVETAGPFPIDQRGEENTNGPRSEPYDWVLADPDLDALEVPTAIGGQEFADGLVFDSRVYQPLSDVAPAQAGDSAATNMQHMAVVRDFVIPGD
jgi:endonuclease/exonuclease/phosphatase family metal-dependent hydrolase